MVRKHHCPFADSESKSADAKRKAKYKEKRRGESMYNIMIVDDCESMRRKIRHLSVWKKFCEFQIGAEAQNGIEALERLEEDPVQVVMTDIRMPQMDGLELLKNIKSRDAAECVILLCEDASFEYAHQGMILGAFDYMVKPVGEKDLEFVLDRIAKYLADKKRERERKGQNVMSFLEDTQQAWDEKIKALEKECTDEGDSQPPIGRMRDQMEQFTYRGKNKTIEKVCAFILSHPEEICRLSDLSERFYINKTYLSHQFKQELGIGLVDYAAKFKMECAKKLLAETKMSSEEIAEAVGYQNGKYFREVFRRQTGQTMTQYRKKRELR